MMNIRGLWDFCCGEFSDTTSEQNNYTYEALTPSIIEPEKAHNYIEALTFACSRPDIKNIAVTGPYGAGKSSVLLTWQQYPCNDFRVMTISLADFDMQRVPDQKTDTVSKDEDNSEAGNKGGEKTIEYSILQQLLYKEKKSSLPYSRIERISDITSRQVAGMAGNLMLMIVLVMTGLLFLFPDYISTKLTLPRWLSHSLLDLPVVCRLSGAGILLFFALFLILKKLHRIGLFDRRVNIDKVDMLKGAISTRTSAPSLLNIYIDEIVYFFEQTKHDVVIFEDLDRYNDGAIFIKLREINQIINNCLPADKPVRFIYAVRDDLFSTPESRTKFFDFVLPVIPVMDSDNAQEHFSSKFNEAELSQLGFRECLARLSVFIPDMRVMHNIANEFRLYRNIVNNGEDLRRLVSLISYKNLCAEDYHGIDHKKGILYNIVFAYVSGDFRRDYEDKYQAEIVHIQSEISATQSEKSDSKRDIRRDILLPYISQKTSGTLHFYLRNNVAISLDDVISNESKFFELISGSVFDVLTKIRGQNVAYVDTSAVKEINDEYKKRCQLLQSKLENRIDNLEKKINSLKGEIQRLYSRELSYFMGKMGSGGFFEWIKERSINEGKGGACISSSEQMEFIYFLLRCGYISTDYMSYRSVFMPGSLTKEDNDFIRAVSAGRSSGGTTVMPLVNIANVIRKLTELGLTLQENAWHPTILHHLLYEDRPLLSKVMLHQTEVGNEHRLIWLSGTVFKQWPVNERLEYVHQLASNGERLEVLIQRLVGIGNTPEGLSLLALLMSIQSLSWDQVSVVSLEKLHQLIAEYTDLITYVPEGSANYFTDNIKKSGSIIQHIPINVGDSGVQVVRNVVMGKLWCYSEDNLKNIVILLSGKEEVSQDLFYHRPLSLCRSLQINEINEVLDENIHDFIEGVFTDSCDYEFVPHLLNSKIIDWKDAECIVYKMNFVLNELDEVNNRQGEVSEFSGDGHRNNLYSLLLHYDRILPSWQNVILLLESEEEVSSGVLCKWFNKGYSALEDEVHSLSLMLFGRLMDKLVVSEVITSEALTSIVEKINAVLINVPDNIPLRNAELLVSHKWLAPTPTVFEELYEVFYDEGNKLHSLLHELVRLRPALLGQNHELILYSDGKFNRELALLIFNDKQIPADYRVGALKWLWERDKEIFNTGPLIELQECGELTLLLSNDDLKLALLVQCLKVGDDDHPVLRSILQTFSDTRYSAVLIKKSHRNIEFSEPMWRLVTLLENTGFIARAKITHGGARIRIDAADGRVDE